jgi:hypothetical protein
MSQETDAEGAGGDAAGACDPAIVSEAREVAGSDLPVDRKKDRFAVLFGKCQEYSHTDALVNMWAVAAMLEDELPIPQKVMAVQGMLESGDVTPQEIGGWARDVYSWKRAPADLLDFIAVYIRNVEGIPADVKQMLEGRS